MIYNINNYIKKNQENLKNLVIENKEDLNFFIRNKDKVDILWIGTYYNYIWNFEILLNIKKIENIKNKTIILQLPFIKENYIEVIKKEFKEELKILLNIIKNNKILFLVNNYEDIFFIEELTDKNNIKNYNIILWPQYFFINYDYYNINNHNSSEELEIFIKNTNLYIKFLNSKITNNKVIWLSFFEWWLKYFWTNIKKINKELNIDIYYFNDKTIYAMTDRLFQYFIKKWYDKTRITNKEILLDIIKDLKKWKNRKIHWKYIINNNIQIEYINNYQFYCFKK